MRLKKSHIVTTIANIPSRWMVAVWRPIFNSWPFGVTIYILSIPYFWRMLYLILCSHSCGIKTAMLCLSFTSYFFQVKICCVYAKISFLSEKGHTLLRPRLFVANLNHFQNTRIHAWHIFFLFYHLPSQKSLQNAIAITL